MTYNGTSLKNFAKAMRAFNFASGTKSWKLETPLELIPDYDRQHIPDVDGPTPPNLVARSG